jgi:lysozyme family protein
MAAVAEQHPEFMIRALCGRRLDFLMGLTAWSVFGTGWRRRVEDVEDRALTLATKQPHFGAALATQAAKVAGRGKKSNKRPHVPGYQAVGASGPPAKAI